MSDTTPQIAPLDCATLARENALLRGQNRRMWSAMQRACNQPERWSEIIHPVVSEFSGDEW